MHLAYLGWGSIDLNRLEGGKLSMFQILAALLLQLLVERVVGILQRERVLPTKENSCVTGSVVEPEPDF